MSRPRAGAACSARSQQYHVLTSYWWMLAPAIALGAIALGLSRAHRARARAREGDRLRPSCSLLAHRRARLPPPPLRPVLRAAGEEDVLASSDCRPPRRTPRRRPARRAQIAQPGRRRRRAVARTSSAACPAISFTSTGSRRAPRARSPNPWKRSADGLSYTLSLRTRPPLLGRRRVRCRRCGVHVQGAAGPGRRTRRIATCSSSAASRSPSRRSTTHTVRVTLAEPYAAAERLFDSIAILPRHLLETCVRAGHARRRLVVEDAAGVDRRTGTVSR